MTMTIAKTMTVLGATLAMSGAALGQSWIEAQKLTASELQQGALFGHDVAIDGDTLVSGATDFDRLTENDGQAYVFVRSDSQWQEQAIIFPDDPSTRDRFGWSVSVSADRVVVGALFGDGREADSGSAYVFERIGAEWTQVAKLIADDGLSREEFGQAVAIDGDTIAVGALSAQGGGAVYVFTFDGASWSQSAKLRPSDGTSENLFGYSVALEGNRLVVGDTDASLDGVQTGAVYVFERTGEAWVETAKLVSDDAVDDWRLGTDVDLSGDRVILGAIWAGDRLFEGRAYIFRKEDSGWVQEANLLSPGRTSPPETFGTVALDGDVAVVGAANNSVGDGRPGRIYVYGRVGTDWVLRDSIRPQDPAEILLFGNSVAIDGDLIASGAALANVDGVARAGAAYVFEPNPCPADLDGDGALTIFDFLAFQNLFDAGDPRADFDGDGELTLFDFLAFQNAFDAGCP